MLLHIALHIYSTCTNRVILNFPNSLGCLHSEYQIHLCLFCFSIIVIVISSITMRPTTVLLGQILKYLSFSCQTEAFSKVQFLTFLSILSNITGLQKNFSVICNWKYVFKFKRKTKLQIPNTISLIKLSAFYNPSMFSAFGSRDFLNNQTSCISY